MMPFPLSDSQLALLEGPIERKVFLEGPAGTGKTTAGVAWLLHLLEEGIPASSILVFVPQRILAFPYHDALRRPTVRAGAQVTVFTLASLARRMTDLFWPLIAEEVGFAHPDRPPTFLTLETAQYYMARLVRPLLDEGYFESVVIDRNRLYSQILDNLNKAAVVGFPHTEIGQRLQAAWRGEQSQKRVYEEAQVCATRFRQYCLAHNLLDFSLQIEVFLKHLWPLSLCRDYLVGTYTHLIADNVEEDVPVAHDVLKEWLSRCRSALVIYDQEGGYRRFLGADPESAYGIRPLCAEHVVFARSFVQSPAVQSLERRLGRSLYRLPPKPPEEGLPALVYRHHKYHPQMLDWVADQIAHLVHEGGVAPDQIAVLAPFMGDALRFSLMSRLTERAVPSRSHRPSRALRDEPATRCLLTLAAIAHPTWGVCPNPFDVAYALMQAIDGVDLVRAQLLTGIVYRVRDGRPTLGSFELIRPAMQERLTFVLGERYERLRTWIEEYVAAGEDGGGLDHFLSRLFGEVLSQPGYGFHQHHDAARVAADLVESVQKFRWVMGGQILEDGKPLGPEYIEMVKDGVVAAQYVGSWRLRPHDAVLLAPAYTFLIGNRPVEFQFWLDVGGSGWWERLYQPLTHPYVLSRQWPPDAVWTDADEFEARQDALYRLVMGLVRRCRRRVYLGLSELDEQGYEQKGPLLLAIQRMLRHLPVDFSGDG